MVEPIELYVLLPTYMDGESVQKIVKEIDIQFSEKYSSSIARYIIVDESLGMDKALNAFIEATNGLTCWKNRVSILKPPFRSGNQGAILWALKTFKWPEEKCSFLAVMDSDGEDSPADLLRLMDELLKKDLDLVYAIRGKRETNLSFKLGKVAFTLLFRILTGKRLDSGNFSVMKLPWLLECIRLGYFSSSFAGELAHILAKKSTLKCDRPPRWDGKSKTNFIGLITFGLRHFIPWSETIAVRSFVFFLVSGFSALFITITALTLKLFFHVTTPVWTTLVSGIAVLLALLTFLLFVMSIAVVIQIDYTRRAIHASEAKR